MEVVLFQLKEAISKISKYQKTHPSFFLIVNKTSNLGNKFSLRYGFGYVQKNYVKKPEPVSITLTGNAIRTIQVSGYKNKFNYFEILVLSYICIDHE